MSRKTKVIGIRVDPEVDGRLSVFETSTGIERVTLARNAMLAALDFYEKHGRISFPLHVVEGGLSKEGSRSPEDIAKLRPEDRGTPVLDVEPAHQSTTG